MKIFVNDTGVELATGMTVRHALFAALGAQSNPELISVRDCWGNPVGLDGTLNEGDHIKVMVVPPGDKHE